MKIKVDETFIFEEKSKSFFGFLNRKITQVNIDDETRIVDLKNENNIIVNNFNFDSCRNRICNWWYIDRYILSIFRTYFESYNVFRIR